MYGDARLPICCEWRGDAVGVPPEGGRGVRRDADVGGAARPVVGGGSDDVLGGTDDCLLSGLWFGE